MPSKAWLRSSLALWNRRVKYRRARVKAYSRRATRERNHNGLTRGTKWRLEMWGRRLDYAQRVAAKRQRQLATPRKNLGEKALDVMRTLKNVREVGGNNVGPMVSKIIRENGGTPGEPWCGDTVAYAFRHAGSKVVQRAWAAVKYLGYLTGMRIVKSPRPGDIVCYKFDHTGIFEKWINKSAGIFLAWEGNTGRTGAVSDSVGGGDGVYEKQRNTTQVARWVRVLR